MSQVKQDTFFTGLKKNFEKGNANATFQVADDTLQSKLKANSDANQIYRQIFSLRFRYSSASVQFKLLFAFIPNVINLIENILLLAITIPALLLKGIWNTPLLVKIRTQEDELNELEQAKLQDLLDTKECLKLETIAICQNIANTLLAVINSVVRGLLTLRKFSYDTTQKNIKNDAQIVSDAKNTLKGPVENYLGGCFNRFFGNAGNLADDATLIPVNNLNTPY